MSKQMDKIFKRISKEEVQLSESVELGVVDDIQKNISSAQALLAEGKDFLAREQAAWAEVKKLEDLVAKQEGLASKVSDNAPKIGSKMEKVVSSMNTTYGKAESAAKDLGINPKTISGLDKFESVYDELEKFANGLNAKIR